ncbi:YheU family protein [Desulfopila inferna]|uniref:YheU family protein n=1 Tax=Desulfopila inferna TaxID=468528 RepID=UPI001F050C12|nr:YheU family protein [Desulfopila inferna]
MVEEKKVPMDMPHTSVRIPCDQLEPDILLALVEEFITREGTDYGEWEVPLEKMIGEVVDQLKTGKAVIIYDQISQTCNILSKNVLKK